jgi:hypothetical protein
MKNIIFKNSILCAALLCSVGLSAQKAWLEPGGTDFNPEATARIYINVSECERQQLVGITEDVYLWTWNPREDRTIRNGDWTSSNDAMKMTRSADNPNIYYFELIATEFYEVSVDQVYERGFSFLAKAKSGADQGNGEMKTEDINIKPEKPGAPKVYTMPAVPKSFKKGSDTAPDTLAVNRQDFLTIFYDNRLETQAQMLNLTEADELHVFIRTTGSDGKKYLNVRKAQLGTDAKSRCRWRGDGLYAVTYNLNDLWVNSGVGATFTPPPADVKPQLIEIQFAKANPANPNVDLVPKADGVFSYFIGRCE